MVFETRLLTTKNVSEWSNLLKRLGCTQQDPHYLLEYLHIYERLPEGECKTHFGGEGLLYFYGSDDNFIIYPFFKRLITAPASYTSSAGPLYDIVSPYGYSGPLAHIEDRSIADKLWKAFFAVFDIYCKENNIVSEFCRLHPIHDNHTPVRNFSDKIVRKNNDIVFIDLTLSEEEIFRGMHEQRRRQARRAFKDPDLDVHFGISDNSGQCFFDIYTETMQRSEARPKYYFPMSFFNDAFEMLRGNIDITSISYKGNVIAAGLTLKYGEIAYYWLSGSKSEYFSLHPNILMICKTAFKLKKEGYKYFILGGGISGRDSLFRFKSRFSACFKEFYVYHKIHLAEKYGELVALRPNSGGTVGEYFPEYRRP